MSEQQIIDGIGTEDRKRYMHHYNFPGYSTGEAKPARSRDAARSVTARWLSARCCP